MTTPEEQSVPSQDQFELGYQPDKYDTLDASRDGRWYTLSVQGEEVGRVWTDGEDGLGFSARPGATVDAISRVHQQLNRYKTLGFDADLVFDAMQIFTGYEASDIRMGSLSLYPEYAVTAAGDEPVETKVGDPLLVDSEGLSDSFDLPEYNFIAIDEDDEVVGAGRSTHLAILMRDAGNWVPLPDDDLRFDGCEWIDVDDATLGEYDKRVDAGLAFTREDLEGQDT